MIFFMRFFDHQTKHIEVFHQKLKYYRFHSAQWDTLKHVLFSLKQEGLSLEDGYRKVLASDSLPDVKRLACFFLVLCLSTVWCERGFSLMAQIKTKLRKCMNIETLDALMMISSNGPKLSDKEAILKLIDEAFAHWLARQKRCLENHAQRLSNIKIHIK